MDFCARDIACPFVAQASFVQKPMAPSTTAVIIWRRVDAVSGSFEVFLSLIAALLKCSRFIDARIKTRRHNMFNRMLPNGNHPKARRPEKP
jgi:hypothetical protein